jgi:predicted nucleic acid-binding protein
VNWANWLDWLKRASVLMDNPHMRPTVRRDPKDDPVLAAAVAGRAKFLVSYDNDFLDLGKPYGVHCIPPREFLAAVLARP